MIITISGDAGTGTTTLAKHLSTTLALPYFHAGALFRELAKSKGITLLAVIEAAKQDPTIDQHIQAELLKLMQMHHNMVVEGRLTSYQAWASGIASFRILLTASPEVQAKRICEREKLDYQHTLHDVRYRDQQDWARYYKLYQISIDQQTSWNNLVVNTDKLSIEETFQVCLKAIKFAKA